MKELEFITPLAWRRWLAKNHDRETGIWVIFTKRGADKPSIGYGAAIDEALCYGWIDSIVRRIDDRRYAPRQGPAARPSPAAERPGTGALGRIVSVSQLDGAGETPIYEPWAPFRLEVTFESADPSLGFHVGALIHAEDDTILSALGSRVCGHAALTGRRRYRIVMDVPNPPYRKGPYHLSILLLDERALHVYDQRQVRRAFGVVGHHWDPGPFGIGQRFLDLSAEDETRGD